MTPLTLVPVQADHDARWAHWKRDGARRDVLRQERLRQLFAAVCLSGAAWLLLQL